MADMTEGAPPGSNSIKPSKPKPPQKQSKTRPGSKLKTELNVELTQNTLGKSESSPDQLHTHYQHSFTTPQESQKDLLQYNLQPHHHNDSFGFSESKHAVVAHTNSNILSDRKWSDPVSSQQNQHINASNHNLNSNMNGTGNNNNSKQFQSVSANLEYSLIGNIISNKPTTHLHSTSPYVDATRSSVSPASLTTSEERSPQQQHHYSHEQQELEQQLRLPGSNTKLNQYTLAYSPSSTAHGQTFTEVLEAVETIENIQNKQNQNLHEWQLDNTKNPKRPISFTIAKSPGGSTINNNNNNIGNDGNHGFDSGDSESGRFGNSSRLDLALYDPRNGSENRQTHSLQNNSYFNQQHHHPLRQQEQQQQQQLLQYQPHMLAQPRQQQSFGKSNHSQLDANGFLSSRTWDTEPADIYARVMKPYSYTSEYHQLTMYIRARFSREDQLKIAKCIASYRPSFIACTNTLKEDDLIFMERCFQRTLIEYEKYISFSGTPTVVWRRTGQIAAVGREFCILTGWPLKQLLSENTFIVELMDDESALEYFEIFSTMAFGDSIGANMTECTLMTPQGKGIKTTSIWTLKRDVFGIPMMIIGNFLPILK